MQDVDKISLNFILSTGRTGSTLLSSMLNMHPKILSVSEEPFAYNLYPKYKNISHWTDKIIEEFCYDFYLFSEGKLEPQFGTKQDLIDVLQEHKNELTGEKAIKLAYFAFFPNKDKSQVNTIVDKELKFHFILNDIIEYYPKSKFIVLCRDPRDNVLIKIKRGIKKNKKRSPLFFAKTWNYEYTTLNKKLGQCNQQNIFMLKYEDLAKNPEESLKKITNFLNVPYDRIMLNFAQKHIEDLKQLEKTISKDSKQYLSMFHEGLTQKINTDKIGIWKTQLTKEENNMIWSVCKKPAFMHGYNSEDCTKIFKFKFHMFSALFRFFLIGIIIPKLYYALPFRMKYFIKKIKYGRNFKEEWWTSNEYFKKTVSG